LWINQDLDALLKDDYDFIVITTGHSDYRNNKGLIEKLLGKPPAFIYDTIGVFTNDEIKMLGAKHIVKVIGRGDL